MIGYFDYTVLATYISACTAFSGILSVQQGDYETALICLLLCGLLDMVDGPIARTKKNREQSRARYGIQIDSLSDLIAFGVLPACIVNAICKDEPFFFAAAFAIVLAALIRLAYFNVAEEARQDSEKGGEPRKSYTGLPVTATALLFPAVYIIGFLPPVSVKLRMYLFAVSAIATAVMFVFPVKVKKPHGLICIIPALIGVIEFALIVIL